MPRQDSDALAVYTQVRLQGDDTWVELPPAARPKERSWERFHRLVARLTLALYGHPLAGLYWENHCRTALLKVGFQAVPGHECLCMHKARQAFLSVYVDDLGLMWKEMQNVLDFDLATDLNGGSHVGQVQTDVIIPEVLVAMP